jgi:hypothetical protein
MWAPFRRLRHPSKLPPPPTQTQHQELLVKLLQLAHLQKDRDLFFKMSGSDLQHAVLNRFQQ